MSDKTELPKEWIEYSINEYSYNPDEQVSFRDGAKAMRDAMEKMLKDEILFQKETYRDEITIGVLTNLAKRLTSLTPTQDGK
jgi:hypothetical protein